MELRHVTTGPDGAPPVVLLHALAKDGTDWALVADALSVDHRVIVPDLRGHGRSVRPGTYSFPLMRDDVVELIEPLGPVGIIGHSMGGTIAYHVVQHRPDLIRWLVIEDTPPPRGVAVDAPPEEPPFHVEFDWQVLVQLTREFNDPDPALWDELATIVVPTLILAGGAGSEVPQDDLAEVAERIPGAQLLDVGGGHFIHEAKPDDYVAAVRGFIGAQGAT